MVFSPPVLSLQFSFLFLSFSLSAVSCVSIRINSITWNNYVERNSNPELNANLAPENGLNSMLRFEM